MVSEGAFESVVAEWHSPPGTLRLTAGDVHVWRVGIDSNVDVDQSNLSEDEGERAARFTHLEARRRFVATRLALREILARYTGGHPRSLRFAYGPHGKPELKDPPLGSSVQFSVAHSREIALIAVTTGRAIGVDLEYVRDKVPSLDLARRFFAPSEVQWLMDLPEAERQRRFFQCWTRKESVVKATGEGLSRGVGSFESVTGEPIPLEGRLWRVVHVSPAAEYVAAVAIEAGEVRFRGFDRPSE